MMKTAALLTIVAMMACNTAFPATVRAAEDQFRVGVEITNLNDFNAPTTPSGLSATAVTSTRIDLDWTASTDNVAVTGYKVFRGFLQIATTTTALYSDTSLTASTTYDYTVSAFDAAGNVSARSATSSATTLPPAPTPTPSTESTGGSPSGSYIPPYIYGVTSESGRTFLIVHWQTDRATISSVKWGRTADYELGSLMSPALSGTHQAYIDGLMPDTVYVVRIEVVDANGVRNALEGIRFKTSAGPDTEPPANVTGFAATPADGSISLSWSNPNAYDFDKVRIVRSEKFFPVDMNDGEVIYEGNGESFEDRDVEKGKKYYYAIFARDMSGNYSSGALASASLIPGSHSENPLDLLPPSPGVDPKIHDLKLEDFLFIQGGQTIPVTDESIGIDGAQNLKIILDYDKVPEVLKTIAFTLTDEHGKHFSFLLRVNKEKSAYEAVIAPLGGNGRYKLGITIVDHKNRGMKRIDSALTATVENAAQGMTDADRNDLLALTMRTIKIFSLLVLIALAGLAIMTKRRRVEKRS